MIIAAIGLAVVMVAAVVLGGRRAARGLEAEYLSRFPAGPNGIVAGAEGFFLPGTNGRSLLVLHGSGDSPQSVRYLAARLNAAGYTVQAPLLAGHGRTPRAFAAATAEEYYQDARRAFIELADREAWVGVVGLSMGGALAARLSAGSTRVRVLVLLAPYFTPPADVRIAHALSWLWGSVAPYVRGGGEESVHDPVARQASRAYGSFSAGALSALVETAAAGRSVLPVVRIPTLIINSQQDNRIPRTLAQDAVDAFTVPPETHWLEGCGHVITVDYCKDAVATLVLTFLARHAG